MQTLRWLGFGLAAMAIAVMISLGCATSPSARNPEARQALAPTGKLRVGLIPGNPISIVRDPVSGQSKGVGYDLGMELARRLGVPFEAVAFERNAELLDALKSGRIDVSFQNATPARMNEMDFTAPYLEIESAFLVRASSSIVSRAELDKPGVKVGATQGSTSFATLSREFKNAEMIPAPNTAAAVEMLTSGKLDAFGSSMATLIEMSDILPGSRILKEPFGVERVAIAIPKGREVGLAYANSFVAEAKSQGLISAAVARAGVRGVNH